MKKWEMQLEKSQEAGTGWTLLNIYHRRGHKIVDIYDILDYKL